MPDHGRCFHPHSSWTFSLRWFTLFYRFNLVWILHRLPQNLFPNFYLRYHGYAFGNPSPHPVLFCHFTCIQYCNKYYLRLGTPCFATAALPDIYHGALPTTTHLPHRFYTPHAVDACAIPLPPPHPTGTNVIFGLCGVRRRCLQALPGSSFPTPCWTGSAAFYLVVRSTGWAVLF